jgi:uncharacterized protein YgiM (DUF1202 family)
MKKLLFILAFSVPALALTAAPPAAATLSRASAENVKMYRQAGTSTQVLRSLKSTDEVMVVRKHNAHWSIVNVEGQVGYVLTSELTRPGKLKNRARTQPGHIR